MVWKLGLKPPTTPTDHEEENVLILALSNDLAGMALNTFIQAEESFEARKSYEMTSNQ